jgi:hypothetical protein
LELFVVPDVNSEEGVHPMPMYRFKIKAQEVLISEQDKGLNLEVTLYTAMLRRYSCRGGVDSRLATVKYLFFTSLIAKRFKLAI